jgi:hypothetical protein
LRLHARHFVHLLQVVVSEGAKREKRQALLKEGKRRSGKVQWVTEEGERTRFRGKYGGAGYHFAQRAVRVFLATLVKELSVAPVDETRRGERATRTLGVQTA